MGDATLHRHGDTIPGPNGPPIVPFPRKHLALSAPGGALVLSPLEILPKERRGSNSGKRSRGRPICNTCVRRTFWCGGRTILRFEYSAAGRGVSSLVGSAWRPTSVLGELTDKAVNSSLTFFLFHRARRIFFLMSQKENAGCIPTVKPCILVPQSGTMLHPCGGSPRPFAGQRKCRGHSNGQSPF